MKRKQLLWFVPPGLALTLLIFRPYPEIDESRVHPQLRGFDDSTECAWTSIMDGGSLAIRIRPSDGKEIFLCLSNSLEQPFFERGQLYIGATHFSEPGSTKIEGYDHSKFVIAKLLAKSIPDHPSVRAHIALLTMRASDWISSFVHGAGSPLW
jgi:hypothetical protein